MGGTMEYQGYHAKIEYDDEDKCFVGQVADVRDAIAFDGETVRELEQAFHDCVDGYLAQCKEWGVAPDKEFRGSFNVRITPALHRSLSAYAAGHNESLNQAVSEAIEALLRSQAPGLLN